MKRVLASRMIRTDVPMIDVFNCLVESQKIPIFSVSGEPYNQLLARIGIQADADVVVFGGLGLIFDDYAYFRRRFEDAGVFPRTVMFINQASDPVVERLLVPDLTLAVAEKFAVQEGKRVLVLLTDMTAFADAMKEVSIAMERVPANRGYPGDLYSQLARRYEKACDFKGSGSVTILAVTTMPGNDLTHPVPDNTGYITEGQFYLHSGVIDPFGSLSRLKQHVIGKVTREDHSQITEHHDPPLFRRARRRPEAGDGLRAVRSRSPAAEVRRPVPQALHGYRGVAAARSGARPLLADAGRMLRAAAAADEAGAGRQILSGRAESQIRGCLMAKPALNKSTLARETRQLAEYRQFLPSLELKRLQILAERARAATASPGRKRNSRIGFRRSPMPSRCWRTTTCLFRASSASRR